MKLERLYPWNWFRSEGEAEHQIPVRRAPGEARPPVQAARRPAASPLHQAIDRMFEDALRDFGLAPSLVGTGGPVLGAFRPSTNVSGDAEGYEVSIEVPGMAEGDIGIELEGDSLFVHGEKQEQTEEKDRYYYRVERSFGRFERVLTLPADADPDGIRARLENGVLVIRIPRRARERGGRTIEIG